MKIVLDRNDPVDAELIDLMLKHLAADHMLKPVEVEPKAEPVKARVAAKPKGEKPTPKKDEITEEEHATRQAKVMKILREKGATAASEYVKAMGAGKFADLTPEQMKALEAKLDEEASNESPKEELGF